MESGQLPPELHLLYDDTLSGVPVTPGSYRFALRVADRSGRSAVRSYTLAVERQALVITTTALPQAPARKPFSFNLMATGGIRPYAWTLVDGDLPSGMKLTPAGVLSGPSWAPARYRFTALVSDATAATARKSLELVVEYPTVRPVRRDIDFQEERPLKR